MINRMIHYALYPLWLVYYRVCGGLALGIETDESGAKMLERPTWKYSKKRRQTMDLAIIKKVEGRWIIDRDSNHVFESKDGVFEEGVYQEIEVNKITPLRRHPNDPKQEAGL